jgi:hypothetical protein
MGQMFLYDAFQNHSLRSSFNLFSLDDVDSTFDKFVKVTYSQEIQLSGAFSSSTLSWLSSNSVVLQVAVMASPLCLFRLAIRLEERCGRSPKRPRRSSTPLTLITDVKGILAFMLPSAPLQQHL